MARARRITIQGAGHGVASMSDELEQAKVRLTQGRLLLEKHKPRTVDPARQSKKLIRDLDLTIAGMEKYLALLRKQPRL